MEKIKVIYWSMTGNTEAMATAIGEGIVAAGKASEVIEVSTADATALKDEMYFALGCPAMGDEVLEEEAMEPFVSEVESFVAVTNIVLFGSYSRNDALWMRDWVERMDKAGANVIEGLMCYDTADDTILEPFRDVDKKLCALLARSRS